LSSLFTNRSFNTFRSMLGIKSILLTRITELSKSLSCLSDNRSGRCGQCVRPIKHCIFPHVTQKCVVLTLSIPGYHLKL
jgi:hypothetical protein